MKKQNGVTLVTLTITIIVMIIIASITSYAGIGLIKQAKLQDLVTTMLLIQVKAKEGVEEVNFQKANVTDQATIDSIKEEYLKGNKVSEANDEELKSKVTEIVGTTENCYYFSQEELNEMGIKDITIEDYGYFVVIYDIDNIKAEIINTKGYQGEHTLEGLKLLQEEQE